MKKERLSYETIECLAALEASDGQGRVMTKPISAQRDVMRILADSTLRLSVSGNKTRIVKNDTNEEVYRVTNGLAGKLVDRGWLRYVGLYELTQVGKSVADELARAAKWDAEHAT